MATRREHYAEAERLSRVAKEGMTKLSEVMPDMPVQELAAATQQLELTVALAHVHATLATASFNVAEDSL